MLVFGHLGITLGVVYVLAHYLGPRRASRIDYRVVLLGSLLSDIIDKPLGLALGIFGRNVAHTLLFASALTLVLGLPLVVPQRMPRAMVGRLGNPAIYLALGVWVHLLLDRMWDYPSVLLWPGLGLGFPGGTFDPMALLERLPHDPYTLGGEVVGLAIILAVALRHRLLGPRALGDFLRSGHLP